MIDDVIESNASNQRIDVTTSSARVELDREVYPSSFNILVSNVGLYDAFLVLGNSSVTAALPANAGATVKGMYVPAGKSLSFRVARGTVTAWTHVATIGTGATTVIVTLGNGK